MTNGSWAQPDNSSAWVYRYFGFVGCAAGRVGRDCAFYAAWFGARAGRADPPPPCERPCAAVDPTVLRRRAAIAVPSGPGPPSCANRAVATARRVIRTAAKKRRADVDVPMIRHMGHQMVRRRTWRANCACVALRAVGHSSFLVDALSRCVAGISYLRHLARCSCGPTLASGFCTC